MKSKLDPDYPKIGLDMAEHVDDFTGFGTRWQM
jgi:hypothetical protein